MKRKWFTKTIRWTLGPDSLRLIQLIADGHTNKYCAGTFSTTEQVIKNRVRKLLSYLGCKNRTELVRHAVEKGMITCRQCEKEKGFERRHEIVSQGIN